MTYNCDLFSRENVPYYSGTAHVDMVKLWAHVSLNLLLW